MTSWDRVLRNDVMTRCFVKGYKSQSLRLRFLAPITAESEGTMSTYRMM
jgi:hypothetical protein